jgi:hypothetical protein
MPYRAKKAYLAVCLTSSQERTIAIASDSDRQEKVNTSIVEMPKKSQPQIQRFPFYTEATIRSNYFELTKHQSAKLRSKLPKGLYWLQIEPRGKIDWNVKLLMDYVISGDRPEHQALVEEYIEYVYGLQNT